MPQQEKPLGTRYEQLFDGKYCQVAVRRGVLGLHDVHFVLKHRESMPHTLCESLIKASEEVSRRLVAIPSKPQGHSFKVYRTGINRSQKLLQRDLSIHFTPVILGSGSRTGDQHLELLESLELLPVPTAVLKIACGAFRIRYGFPETVSVIGKTEDRGDLLQGYHVRTAREPRGGSAKTQSGGISGSFAWGIALPDLMVAGAKGSDDLRVLVEW